MGKTKGHEKSPAAVTAERTSAEAAQAKNSVDTEYQKSEDVSSVKAVPEVKKARNWTFLAYPTEIEPNTPEDWRERIDAFHVPWVEGPLHGGDYRDNYEDIPEGERDEWWPFKKPHIHVIMSFPNPRSVETMKWLCKCINATRPEACKSLGGEVRYLAHYTWPEKTQYPISEIKPHCGFVVAKHFELEVDIVSAKQEIVEYVIMSGCRNMAELVRNARRIGKDDWVRTLAGKGSFAYFVETLLFSNRSDAKLQKEKYIERVKASAVREGNVIKFKPENQAEGSGE